MAKKLAPYGAVRYRTPVFKNEFVYPAGILPEAVVLDLDDCFVSFGNKVNQDVMAWLDKHYRLGRMIIVITARTHQHEYVSSFNMLVRELPYAFFGPICRPTTDPRYASEFKRDTAEYLSGIYRIVGAADDNEWVCDMWRWWAKEYGPADFDLLQVKPPSYSQWRKDLPPKEPNRPPFYSSVTPLEPKNRVAGTRSFGGGDDQWNTGWEQPQQPTWWDHYATTGSTSGKAKDLDTIDGEFFIDEVGT